MREIFLQVQYVVCWAGCQTPFKERSFTNYEDALKCYTSNLDKLSLRIEEVSTRTQVKIIFPEIGRK